MRNKSLFMLMLWGIGCGIAGYMYWALING